MEANPTLDTLSYVNDFKPATKSASSSPMLQARHNLLLPGDVVVVAHGMGEQPNPNPNPNLRPDTTRLPSVRPTSWSSRTAWARGW